MHESLTKVSPAQEQAQADAADAFLAVFVGIGRHLRLRAEDGDTEAVEATLLPILWNLRVRGPMRHTALAERLGVDASTVSRQVRTLEARGLVSAACDVQDGRARVVEVTASGVDALRQHLARRRDVVARAIAEWPTADAEMFRNLLARLSERITSWETAE